MSAVLPSKYLATREPSRVALLGVRLSGRAVRLVRVRLLRRHDRRRVPRQHQEQRRAVHHASLRRPGPHGAMLRITLRGPAP